MRIVSQAELKAMPPGTLYAEYSAGRGWPDGPTDIFVGDNEGMNDFFLKSLGSPASSGSGNLFARQHEMDEKGTSYPIGLETDREGLYDDTLRYVIWEAADVAAIIAHLSWLENGQGEWNATCRYRVRRADGHAVFVHDEDDARMVARGTGTIERLYERHESEWRPVS
jgi:hypothetical protein